MLRENLSHPVVIDAAGIGGEEKSSALVVRIRPSHSWVVADTPRSASGMFRPPSRADARGFSLGEFGARRNPKIRHNRIGADKASQDSPSQMPSPNKAKARPALERRPTSSGVRNTCQAVRWVIRSEIVGSDIGAFMQRQPDRRKPEHRPASFFRPTSWPPRDRGRLQARRSRSDPAMPR